MNELGRASISGANGRPPAVRIRPIRATDREALRTFYAALSDESRRTRFLGAACGIGETQSLYFSTPDHRHREGFVAITGPAGPNERIVGHVCIEPDGASCAEVAVAAAEDLRGRGVGKRLAKAAVEWARQDGYATLSATMLAGNVAIQRLLTGLGMPATTVASGAGTIEIRLELEAAGHAAA